MDSFNYLGTLIDWEAIFVKGEKSKTGGIKVYTKQLLDSW